MGARRWLRRRRYQPRIVTITLELDATGFTDRILRAQEATRVTCYRARIRQERTAAFKHLDRLLNDMCTDLGLDPETARQAPDCDKQLGAFRLEPWQAAWLQRLHDKITEEA